VLGGMGQLVLHIRSFIYSVGKTVLLCLGPKTTTGTA
jgi:hypothetical protein